MPPSWFADHMHVTMRTVVRWFDGGDITNEVFLAVKSLENQAEIAVDVLVDEWRGEQGDPLYTYRTDEECPDNDLPASWYRAVVFRAAERIARMGLTAEVEYVKP